MDPLSYDPAATYQLSQQRVAGAERAAEADRRVREVRAAARASHSPHRRGRWSLAAFRRLRVAH